MMSPDVTHPAANSTTSKPSHITSSRNAVLDTSTTTISSSEPNILTQPSKLPDYSHDAPIIILHPSTAEVLHRVEAESIIDVETYVRAEGDKKYAAVKETRKEQLLHRAKRKYGTEQLDDLTVRRQTNLASAKASRAKKNFILDELHTQLKRKSDDAQILAIELRRVLALVEHLGAAKKFVERQLHQQKTLNSFLLKRTAQIQNSPLSDQTGTRSSEKLYEFPSHDILVNHKNSGVLDHTMLEVDEDLEAALSLAVHDDHVPHQAHFYGNGSGEEVHGRGCAGMAEVKLERAEHVDVTMGIPDDVEIWKATVADVGAHLLIPDNADPEDLSMYNPSDQFAVAG